MARRWSASGAPLAGRTGALFEYLAAGKPIVGALAVLAGVLITRGVLGIPVLAPKAASDFGDSSTAVYAGLAAGCALLATALLHVLLLGTPRPFMFFTWITGLADVVAGVRRHGPNRSS